MAGCLSFPYVAAKDARILLLGSMPGVASLAAGEYYAHPANLFWTFLQQILGEQTRNYRERLQLLKKNRIALWDVARFCEREGSLDQAIRPDSVIPNDIPALLRRCPEIRIIFFNGQKAEALYRRLIKPHPAIRDSSL